MLVHKLKLKIAKAPYRGRGGGHPLPRSVASLPRNITLTKQPILPPTENILSTALYVTLKKVMYMYRQHIFNIGFFPFRKL